jgi:hypothetical protein
MENVALLNKAHKTNKKLCFYCKKPGHFVRNCLEKKSDEKEKANQAYEDQEQMIVTALGANDHTTYNWIIDSGPTQHMTFKREWFITYESIVPRKVYMGDDTILEAIGKGSTKATMQVEGRVLFTTITQVLHVPKMKNSLISVSKLISKGFTVEFDKDGCKVNNAHGTVVAEAQREKNLYLFNVNVQKDNANVAKSSNEGATLWHQRLGHLNMASLTKLEKMVNGMNLKEVPLHHVCETCIEGKHQRTSFPKDEATMASKLLELMHSNVCGPMKTTSCGGARYFVTFIDDFSRKTHVYLLKGKGEVFEKFKAYKALVNNQTGMKIKTLRSDNGGEFVSKKFDNFLHECGIQRQTSAPYTPQQNGVAKRANRTIMECARSMICAQGLDLEFWAEVVNMTIYIKNQCPTKALESKTPQEAWTGRKPNVSHLRVFGCKTFADNPDENISKLESKSMPCVFLGYCEGTKAYRLMCVETKRIINSRDVVFLEGMEKVEGVHDNRTPSKQVEHVVDEVMNDDELVKDANPISLKERQMEDMEGDESTSNSSSEEEFATSHDEGLNEPQQDGPREKAPKTM